MRAAGRVEARRHDRQRSNLIFSDTCLNGMIEVTEQLKDYATCIVGSEDLEPGDGWGDTMSG